MRKQIINSMLALAVISSLSACSNTGLTASSFGVMGSTTTSTTVQDTQKGQGREFAKGGEHGMFQLTAELKAKYPTLEAELKALNDSMEAENKVKMDALFVKYPELKPVAPALPTELTTKYPTIQADLDAIKDLTGDARKTKMDELIVKYPELANMQKGQDGEFGKDGKAPQLGMGGHGMFQLPTELTTKYPTIQADLDAIKDLTGNARKTKMDELIVKYPELKPTAPVAPALPTELTTKYPTIQADFDALKGLTPEERKTKMDELIVKYPELANMQKGPRGEFGKDGQGLGFGKDGKVPEFGMGGHGMFQLTDELKAKYPTFESELTAIRDSLETERKAKMDELIVKYPELKPTAPVAPALPTELTTKYPTIQADFDALKDLTGDARKTKMDELIVKYPELANMQKGQGREFAKGGQGGHGFGQKDNVKTTSK